jgi:negative regulator of flagellin synthesis FlgM
MKDEAMNNTIKPGLTGQSQPPVRRDDAVAGGKTDTAASSSIRPSDDSVKLTDSAKALDSASRAGDAIDTQRVDRVRASLADGSYQVNPANIADKLIASDQALAKA